MDAEDDKPQYHSWGSLHKQDIECLGGLLDEMEKKINLLSSSKSSKRSKEGKTAIERNKKITNEIYTILFESEQQHPSTANSLSSATPFSASESIRIQRALTFIELHEKKLTLPLDEELSERLASVLCIADVEDAQQLEAATPQQPSAEQLAKEYESMMRKAITYLDKATRLEETSEETKDIMDIVKHL